VPLGHVISTVPRPRAPLPRGSNVDVLVSTGPQTIEVPNVAGELQSAATADLLSAGLTPGTVTQQGSSQPAGTVLSQAPAGGSLVQKDASVDLVVAKQPQQLTLINVVGDSQAQAGQALGASGLKLGTVTTRPVTDPGQNNLVVAQSPPGGTTVNRGSKVNITVGAFTPSTSTSATGTTGVTGPATTTSTAGPGPAAVGP
jgi:eukaryotic-like serine/threonine-protein kinase